MSRRIPGPQNVLYVVFLVTCAMSVGVALLLVWGAEPTEFLLRLLGTTGVLALGSALTMSATHLAADRRSKHDDDG